MTEDIDIEEAMTPDEAVLHWLYVKDRKIERDALLAESGWSSLNVISWYLFQYSNYMGFPALAVMVYVTIKVIQYLCLEQMKQFNQNNQARSRCKSKSAEASTSKRSGKEEKVSVTPGTEAKKLGYLNVGILQRIPKLLWINRWMNRASMSPENKTAKRQAISSFKLTRYSPQKKLSNPGSKAISGKVPANTKQTSYSIELTGNNLMNNDIKSSTAICYVSNEISSKAEATCSGKKSETGTNIMGTPCAKPIDHDNKEATSQTKASIVLPSNLDKPVAMSTEFQEDRNSIPPKVLWNRIAIETVAKAEEKRDNRQIDPKEMDKNLCKLSALAVDKFQKMSNLFEADCKDSAHAKKRGITDNKTKVTSDLGLGSHTTANHTEMNPGSKIEQYDIKSDQHVSDLENNNGERVLEVLFVKKDQNIGEEEHPNNNLKTTAVLEENQPKHKPLQCHPKSKFSINSSVDEAAGDLLSGDFSSICRKYQISKECSETAPRFSSAAHYKRRKSTTKCHDYENARGSKKRTLRMAEKAGSRLDLCSSLEKCPSLNPIDESESYFQAEPCVMDTFRYIEKLPSASKRKEHYKMVNQATPKPSRKFTSMNSESDNRGDPSPSSSLQDKLSEQSVPLDSTIYPLKKKQKLKLNKGDITPCYRYVMPLSSLTSKLRDHTVSSILSEHSTETENSIEVSQDHDHKRQLDKSTEYFSSDFDAEKNNRKIKMSTYTAHSSSPLSLPVHQQNDYMQYKDSTLETAKPTSFSKKSNWISEYNTKQNMKMNSPQYEVIQNQHRVRLPPCCNEGMSDERSGLSGNSEGLLDYRMNSSQLRKVQSQSLADNASMENVSAWLSTVSSDNAGCSDASVSKASCIVGKHADVTEASYARRKHSNMTEAYHAIGKHPEMTEASYARRKHADMTEANYARRKHSNFTEAHHAIGKHPEMTDASYARRKHADMTEANYARRKHSNLTEAYHAIGKHPEITEASYARRKHADMTEANYARRKHSNLTEAHHAIGKHPEMTEASYARRKHGDTADALDLLGGHTGMTEESQGMDKYTSMTEVSQMMGKHTSAVGDGLDSGKRLFFTEDGLVLNRHAGMADAAYARGTHGFGDYEDHTISRHPTMSIDKDSIFQSCVQGRFNNQYVKNNESFHQGHKNDKGSVMPHMRRKFACSASRSYIPIKKKAVVGTMSHDCQRQDHVACNHLMARSFVRTNTPGQVFPSHTDGAKMSASEVSLQVNDHEEVYNRPPESIYRKSLTYQDCDPHQFYHSGTTKQCKRTSKPTQCRKCLSTSYRNSLENRSSIVANLATQRRQEHFQRKRFQYRQRSSVTTCANINALKSGLKIADKNMQHSKSPDFIHLPLFENKRDETVNIVVRLNSAEQKAFMEKQTLDPVVRAVQASRGSSSPGAFRGCRLYELAKPESKQEPAGTSVWSDMVSLSENQNASPRVFSEQKRNNRIIPTHTVEKQTPTPGAKDCTGLFHFRRALLSKRRQHGQIYTNNYKGGQNRDTTLTNYSIRPTDRSDFHNFNDEELISTASSFQLQQDPTSIQVTKITTEDAVKQGFNKPYPTDTSTTLTHRLSQDQQQTNRKTLLYKKNTANPENCDKLQVNKTPKGNYTLMLSHKNSRTTQNAQVSYKYNQKHFVNEVNNTKQNSTTTEPNLTPYCPSSFNDKTNSKHRKMTNEHQDDVHTNKHDAIYCRSTLLEEDTEDVLKKDRAPSAKEKRTEICYETPDPVSNDDCSEISTGNYSEMQCKYSRLPNKNSISAKNNTVCLEEFGTGTHNEISTRIEKGITSDYHRGISTEFPVGIHSKHRSRLINYTIARPTAENVTKISNKYLTSLHNERLIGTSNENTTQIYSRLCTGIPNEHRSEAHIDSKSRPSTDKVKNVFGHNIGVSTGQSTGISNDNKAKIPTESIAKLCSRHSARIFSQYRVAIDSQHKTELHSRYSAEIQNQYSKGIPSQYMTGIPNQKNTEIPSESHTNISTENMTKLCGSSRRESLNRQSSRINNEHRIKTMIDDKADMIAENRYNASSKDEHKESRHMLDSKFGLTVATYAVGQTSGQGQKFIQCDLDDPSSNGPDESRTNPNAEHTVSMLSQTETSKCDDRGDSDVKREVHMPRAEASKTPFAKTNLLKRRLNLHRALSNVSGPKPQESATTFAHKKIKTDPKCAKTATENKVLNFKTKQQARKENATRIESAGFIFRTDQLQEKTELYKARGKSASDTISAARSRRFQQNEHVRTTTLDEIFDAKCRSQLEDNEALSSTAISDLSKSVQVSLQRQPLLHLPDGHKLLGKPTFHTKNQPTQSKTKWVVHDVRRPQPVTAVTKSQASDTLVLLHTISTLQSNTHIPEEDPTLSSSIHYTQSSTGKIDSQCGGRWQAKREFSKLSSKTSLISNSKNQKAQDHTSNQTSPHYIPPASEISTFLVEDLSQEKNTCKQTKVKDVPRITYLDQKTCKLINKHLKEDEKIQSTASTVNSTTSSPLQVTPTWPVTRSLYRSNCPNLTTLKDSIAYNTDVHLRTDTQDKTEEPNKAAEALLKKILTLSRGQKRGNIMKESSEEQSGHSKNPCLKPNPDILSSSCMEANKDKSHCEISKPKMPFADAGQEFAWTHHEQRKTQLKLKKFPDSKCEMFVVGRSQNSQLAAPIHNDSQCIVSKQTELKNCEVLKSLQQRDVSNHKMDGTNGKHEVINSDLQTFVASGFDDTDDYRLPDSLPGKIDGSTGESSGSAVFGDESTKNDVKITGDKERVPVNTTDKKPWNVDELREKYLREMTLRGLCRDTTTNTYAGMYTRLDDLIQPTEYVAHQHKLGSNTMTIRSASPDHSAPRIVISGQTMTVDDSLRSYSICSDAKIDLKLQQESDEHPGMFTTTRKGKNHCARKDKQQDIKLSRSSQEKTTRDYGKMGVNSANRKLKKQDPGEAKKTWHRPSTPDISLNQSSSCLTAGLVSKSNKQSQYETVMTASKDKSDLDIQCRSKSCSRYSSTAPIPPKDPSERQTNSASEKNRTKNASYTLCNTQPSNIHLSVCENSTYSSGLHRKGQLSSSGRLTHILGNRRSSRIPKIKRLEAISRRVRRSDTQCLSFPHYGSEKNIGRRDIKRFRSLSYNITDTKITKLVDDTEQSQNSENCSTVSSKDQQKQRCPTASVVSHYSSTDIAASWLDKSNLQELTSKSSLKDVLKVHSNCRHVSSPSALNFLSPATWNSHNKPGKQDDLTSKTLISSQREAGDTLDRKDRHDRSPDDKTIFNATSRNVKCNMRRRPHLKSFFDKLPKNSKQDGDLTRTVQAKRDCPFWESSGKNHYFLEEFAADVKNCTDQDGTRSCDFDLEDGRCEVTLSDKHLSTAQGVCPKAETETRTSREENMRSYILKDRGMEPKMRHKVNECAQGTDCVIRCARNRKYVNSALMYNMKKKRVVSPNKQHSQTRQHHFEVKDPALGTNNSARLNKQDVHKIRESPLFNFNVSNRDNNSANKIHNNATSTIGETSGDSSEFLKDQNAVYFMAKQEPFCDNRIWPTFKPEMFREHSETELAQRTSLAKGKCETSRCEIQQSSVTGVALTNQNVDLSKVDYDQEMPQDGHSCQLSQEDTEDDETEEDDKKDSIQENYHTSGPMFVASNSCKVNFDWYKPSATLAAQATDNGQANSEHQQTRETVGTRNLPTVCDARGTSDLSSNYRTFQTQDHISEGEMSCHLWQSLNHQQPDHPPFYESTHCSVSNNFISRRRQTPSERTHSHKNPNFRLPVTQFTLNTSFNTASSRPRNPILHEMNENFIDYSQATNSSHNSETTFISDSGHQYSPDTGNSSSQPHRMRAAPHEQILTTDDSVSNLNSVYQTLQKDYSRTNAVFHSNWVLANQNNSLSLLAPIPAQFYFCNSPGAGAHINQAENMYQYSYSETTGEDFNSFLSHNLNNRTSFNETSFYPELVSNFNRTSLGIDSSNNFNRTSLDFDSSNNFNRTSLGFDSSNNFNRTSLGLDSSNNFNRTSLGIDSSNNFNRTSLGIDSSNNFNRTSLDFDSSNNFNRTSLDFDSSNNFNRTSLGLDCSNNFNRTSLGLDSSNNFNRTSLGLDSSNNFNRTSLGLDSSNNFNRTSLGLDSSKNFNRTSLGLDSSNNFNRTSLGLDSSNNFNRTSLRIDSSNNFNRTSLGIDSSNNFNRTSLDFDSSNNFNRTSLGLDSSNNFNRTSLGLDSSNNFNITSLGLDSSSNFNRTSLGLDSSNNFNRTSLWP